MATQREKKKKKQGMHLETNKKKTFIRIFLVLEEGTSMGILLL